MLVDVGRDPDVAVPELVTYDLQRHAMFQQPRGSRVTQIVNPDGWKVLGADRSYPLLAHRTG